MTTLEKRVSVVLEKGKVSPDALWQALIELFRRDREAFYLLACDGVSRAAHTNIRKLADLARQVRNAIRRTYQVTSTENGAAVELASGESIPVPQNARAEVAQFLLEIDGKSLGTVAGKDYEGSAASEAEVRFKLADASQWAAQREQLRKDRVTEPFVLRVDQSDIENLRFQPAYVTHGLLNCARKTVLGPTQVFMGLQRGEGSCEDVQDGWAFCGLPKQAFGNDGLGRPGPAGMVYVVFADKDGFVFDWDWVEENPGEPGCPIDRDLRFGNPIEWKRDAVLDLPTDLRPGLFDASRACYSERGDCIFCYISDEVAFAARINPDLTVFRKLGSDTITGFKVKNLGRILREDKSIILEDGRELTVSVRGALLATLKGHRKTEVKVYEIIIESWRTRVEAPTVRVPRRGLGKAVFQPS